MESSKEREKCSIVMEDIMKDNGEIIKYLDLEDFFIHRISLLMLVIGIVAAFMVQVWC